ncbi:MAG TPA: alcohol dehydrogenase catalytic domain-containing protein [Paraburkholderia sp.]|uniref:alcohol dehydrogenase catalytic domain-containing protein n=1 Tax=Paraburkholderia sp. TaxID=1926495 RepID=UPI002B46C028|nr:alcohol dehydrogenase catalytic domain-containing protein [Paraburkholderia sp.]HKR46931.1 alcohol dehydrogenase catalytic domain-containing protein [Paraburkholderia sp.]
MTIRDVLSDADERTNVQDADASLMRAARLHKKFEPLTIDLVPRPSPRASDVLVQVKACGIVPNVVNVLNYSLESVVSLPPLPAIFGLDAAGVVAAKGELVHGVEVGDRVYVNPIRYCGSCRYCRMGQHAGCEYSTLNGYFGMGSKALQMFQDYPYGGYAEYMTAPQYSLVKLPENVSFETAARWGYLGTAYAALRRASVDMSSTVLINGVSGTLGVGGVLFALALGVPKILGVGRDIELLERVKAIDPHRIHVHSTNSRISVAEWVRSHTDGCGADVVLDALPTGAPAEAFLAALDALGKCGRHVNCSGVLECVPINVPKYTVSSQTLIGSCWFTTAQGQEMAELAASGRVNLDVFENRGYALEDINTALAEVNERKGGFSNFVVLPDERRSK